MREVTCGHEIHYARGLCRRCYQRLHRNGEKDTAPLVRRDPAEVIMDVEHSRVTFWDSERVGYEPRSLANLLIREKQFDLLRKLGGEREAKRAAIARRRTRDRDSANADRAD